MAHFGSIFVANMGVGVVKIVFKLEQVVEVPEEGHSGLEILRDI